MRRWWLPLSLVVAGFVLLSALGGVIAHRVEQAEQAEILPGWEIIRPPHEISALAEQGEIIWAGGKDGVFALDRGTGILLHELQDEKPFRYVRALLVDRAGNLWIGHHEGLTCYDGVSFCHNDMTIGLPHNKVTALLEDRQGTIWAGTFGGVAHQLDDRWSALTAADGLLVDMVNVIAEDSRGGLWFGSYVAPRGGLSYLKNGQWQYFSTAEGLPHNNINTLIEDQHGATWVGTGFYDRGGAVKLLYDLPQERWILDGVFGPKEGLPGAKVRSIYQDREGDYWFGTEYDGLLRQSGSLQELYTIHQGLSDNEVKAMLQDANGNLWLGTHDGITRVDASAL